MVNKTDKKEIEYRHLYDYSSARPAEVDIPSIKKSIPYGRQDITQADINAVISVLESDFLTQGSEVPKFEQEICGYTKAEYGVATNSATSALHLACLALGLKQGDSLWTSSITFVASANCGLYCGATIDFVDIDEKTYNLSPRALEDKLIQAEKQEKLPKIVIPVHFAGQSCEMAKIHELSQKYGFSIIEDASHAVGGKYQSDEIGNCCFSDITVFSFHPVKIITTGEGGMATTNDSGLAKKMRLLRSHGITRDTGQMEHKSDSTWYYEQIELGFNYRMTDIHAALGVSQIQRLDHYITIRHKISAMYNEAFKDFPIKLPYQHPDSYSSFHLYVICLQTNVSISHKSLFKHLRDHGIGVNLHYIPVYRQPYYRKMGFNAEDYPNAENYYGMAISLPIYPGLSENQQLRVIETMHSVLQNNSNQND
jgi:UDP-4-amino-4,6-dideoxy-N-acetyl-beta-L-altrosamine transaminase